MKILNQLYSASFQIVIDHSLVSNETHSDLLAREDILYVRQTTVTMSWWCNSLYLTGCAQLRN